MIELNPMPTVDERRKVAARLREIRENLEETPAPSDLGEACFIYLSFIAKSIGGGEIFTRLADLVEPDERTCEMYRDEDGVWHCKSCEDGADKITGSDGTLDNWCDSWHPNYCPNCGCRVKEEPDAD